MRPQFFLFDILLIECVDSLNQSANVSKRVRKNGSEQGYNWKRGKFVLKILHIFFICKGIPKVYMRIASLREGRDTDSEKILLALNSDANW